MARGPDPRRSRRTTRHPVRMMLGAARPDYRLARCCICACSARRRPWPRSPRRCSACPARAISRARTTADRSGRALVTADLHADAADAAMPPLEGRGVPADDFSLLRLDAIQPGPPAHPGRGVVWADLLGQAGENARPVARYLAFMAAAGIIAAYGVVYCNEILIVGAMAVSPDLLPITAICIGLVLRRGPLVGRRRLDAGGRSRLYLPRRRGAHGSAGSRRSAPVRLRGRRERAARPHHGQQLDLHRRARGGRRGHPGARDSGERRRRRGDLRHDDPGLGVPRRGGGRRRGRQGRRGRRRARRQRRDADARRHAALLIQRSLARRAAAGMVPR